MTISGNDTADFSFLGDARVMLIWHPHIHCLVTDGVFDLAGSFQPLPKIGSDQATIIFREKVFPACASA